jgi:hypothetical protein
VSAQSKKMDVSSCISERKAGKGKTYEYVRRVHAELVDTDVRELDPSLRVEEQVPDTISSWT